MRSCASHSVVVSVAGPAGTGSAEDADCELVETEDGYRCVDSSPGSPGGGSDSSGGPTCVWTPFRPNLPQADYDPEFYDDPGFTGTYDGSGDVLVRIWPDGRTEQAYTVFCGSAVRLVWVETTITPRELAERAFAEVRVPPPITRMSPAADVGGVVNLGMWLAIESQPDLRDTETEGSVSIELIGEYQGMRWEFGNGDFEECDDFGLPYPEGSNDPGEGPCGYTYEFDENGEAPYTVTVTTTWSFRFTSSSDSGPLGDLTGRATFDYQVYEIQTVGTGR